MNILTDALVEELVIDGIAYSIDTDFRNCLRIMLAFEDTELTDAEKQMIMLYNLFGDQIPDNVEAAIKEAITFLDGNLVDYQAGTKGKGVRLFSWKKDATFIFAAFRQTHSIDLSEAQMHWHKFMALFMDLGSQTTFCQLVSFRDRLASGKASSDEKRAAQELGEIVEVQYIDTRTLEEKETMDNFYKLYEEGLRVRENGKSNKS